VPSTQLDMTLISCVDGNLFFSFSFYILPRWISCSLSKFNYKIFNQSQSWLVY